MRRKIGFVTVVAALVALIVLMGAMPVYACAPCGDMGGDIPCTNGDVEFAGGIFRLVDINSAAGAMGSTSDQVSNELWSGKTLSDLVEAAGVDLAFVRDAVDAERYRALVDADYKAGDRPDLCGSVACDDGSSYMEATAKLGLRLRFGPGTGHAIYRVVKAGTVLEATGNSAMAGSVVWMEVNDGGKIVWAASMYLKPI